MVVDLNGVAQPGLGLITLMYDSGLHTGASVTVDSQGQFNFTNLTPGNYQLRFDAPGKARIPDGVLHPIRFAVKAGEPTPVVVDVEIGAEDYAEIEIYAGDYFYQWQPNGIENGEAVAKIGVLVCWYNVGNQIHTVTGGPWGDSGDLQRTASFMWVADRAGVFGYRDKYFPSMLGTLRIIP
jgi:plastocyanin